MLGGGESKKSTGQIAGWDFSSMFVILGPMPTSDQMNRKRTIPQFTSSLLVAGSKPALLNDCKQNLKPNPIHISTRRPRQNIAVL